MKLIKLVIAVAVIGGAVYAYNVCDFDGNVKVSVSKRAVKKTNKKMKKAYDNAIEKPLEFLKEIKEK